jgi:hypothetical protein
MNAETGRRCRPEQALVQGAGGDAFGNFLRITAVESQNVAGSKDAGRGIAQLKRVLIGGPAGPLCEK